MSSETTGPGDGRFNPKMGRRFIEARRQPTMRRAVFLRLARGFGVAATRPPGPQAHGPDATCDCLRGSRDDAW